MRILVTGASGFIGEAVTRHLFEQGHYVVAAGRRPVVHCQKFIALPNIESTDWTSLTADVDGIVHLAAIAHTRGVSLHHLRAVNCDAVVALARAIRPEQKLIFMSSIRAQGRAHNGTALEEADEAHPEDDYGRMKLEAEKQVMKICPQACILRPVTVYGPGVKAGMRRLSQLLQSNLPLPFAWLNARRSYLALETAVAAVQYVANQSLTGIYNLCDPEPISLSELATWYRVGQGRPARLFGMPEGLLLAGATMFGLHVLASLAFEPLPVSGEKLRASGFQSPFATSRQSIEHWARSVSC